MPHKRSNPKTQNKEKGVNGERFESDTQKIVHRHLEDENHTITEEEIRNVRIGMTPPLDQPTEQAVAESEERIADRKTDDESETVPGAQKATPWDVIADE